MKEAYYFPHDYNARNDPKMVRLLFKRGPAGHGIFWAIIEMLYEQGGELPVADIPLIAKELYTQVKVVDDVVRNYGLFEISGAVFSSLSAIRRLSARNGIRQERQAAASVKWGRGLDQVSKLKRSERLSRARQIASHTDEEWREMVAFFGTCVKCRGESQLNGVVKDHIVPIYQGGSDGIFNLQPLCAKCNASKGADNTDYRMSFSYESRKKMPSKWLQNACMTTAIKERKGKNKKEDISPYSPPSGVVVLPDWLNKETWSAFKETRQKMRAPLTNSAAKLLLTKLSRFRADGDDPNLVLEQSITNGYRGIFPLKDKTGGGNGKKPIDESPVEGLRSVRL